MRKVIMILCFVTVGLSACDEADVPNYLHEFMDQVNETINAFNR